MSIQLNMLLSLIGCCVYWYQKNYSSQPLIILWWKFEKQLIPKIVQNYGSKDWTTNFQTQPDKSTPEGRTDPKPAYTQSEVDLRSMASRRTAMGGALSLGLLSSNIDQMLSIVTKTGLPTSEYVKAGLIAASILLQVCYLKLGFIDI